jgi:hypothetical protein
MTNVKHFTNTESTRDFNNPPAGNQPRAPGASGQMSQATSGGTQRRDPSIPTWALPPNVPKAPQRPTGPVTEMPRRKPVPVRVATDGGLSNRIGATTQQSANQTASSPRPSVESRVSVSTFGSTTKFEDFLPESQLSTWKEDDHMRLKPQSFLPHNSRLRMSNWGKAKEAKPNRSSTLQ